ncbi:MAG: YvcK family protein [Chloroflexi bacterium]|nr:YvcK family protein [Chloroflexota bacterium]
MKENFKAVCIGGGCGASQVMAGLKAYTKQITGIIAVTDSGRSTGKIRIAMNVPAPGDIRNALVTRSDGDPVFKQLFQHRFSSEKLHELDGMAFGNLFLAALTQMTGSFELAVKEATRLLQLTGRVLPVTLYSTHLCAELADGTVVQEEFNVRALNKPPIKRVFLQHPDIEAYRDCMDALQEADLITIGPGSLYTTVIACLLVKGVAKAIVESRAVRVYVCNTTTQPGQTDGLSLSQHVSEVLNYLGSGAIDYALINSSSPPEDLRRKYAEDGVYLLEPHPEEVQRIQDMGITPVLADFVDATAGKRSLWEKQDSVRHVPERVAAELVKLIQVTERE